MKKILPEHIYILWGFVVGVFVVALFSHLAFQAKVATLQGALEASLESVDQNIQELSGLIGRGGVNDKVASIIIDCTSGERAQFEDRLTKLESGLNKSQLTELSHLFSRCAATQSTERAIMTLQLEEKVYLIERLMVQRKALSSYSERDERLKQIQTLLMLEQSITQMSFELVSLQETIIEALFSGLSVDAVESNVLREKGALIRNELIEQSEKASQMRNQLRQT